MSNTGFIYCILIVLFPFIISCEKDDEVEVNEIDAFFTNNQKPVKGYTISGDQQEIVTLPSGSVVTIPANSFIDKTGNPVSGDINLQVKELFKKRDILFSGIPTITNTGDLLVSAGEFNITAMQGNQQLSLANTLSMEVPASNPDPEMELFVQAPDSISQNSSWIPADSSRIVVTNTGYSYSFDNLNWINIDKFMDNQNTVTLEVRVPSGFDLSNARAFIIFRDLNSVIRLYGSSNNIYSQSNIPVGEDVALVVIAERDGELYYSSDELTASQDEMINVIMQQASEDDIEAYLETFD